MGKYFHATLESSNGTTIEHVPYTLQMTILMIILTFMLIVSFISVVGMSFLLLRILIQPVYDGIVGYFQPYDMDQPIAGVYNPTGSRVKQIGILSNGFQPNRTQPKGIQTNGIPTNEHGDYPYDNGNDLEKWNTENWKTEKTGKVNGRSETEKLIRFSDSTFGLLQPDPSSSF